MHVFSFRKSDFAFSYECHIGYRYRIIQYKNNNGILIDIYDKGALTLRAFDSMLDADA